jgi:hypothetical protein
MKIILFFSSLLIFSHAGYCQTTTPELKTTSIQQVVKADSLSYIIISPAGTDFGYDIFLHNKLLIHQPTIPGISGLKGFRNKEDAVKVAILVINKLKKNIFPPTVSQEEMQKLNIDLK